MSRARPLKAWEILQILFRIRSAVRFPVDQESKKENSLPKRTCFLSCMAPHHPHNANLLTCRRLIDGQAISLTYRGPQAWQPVLRFALCARLHLQSLMNSTWVRHSTHVRIHTGRKAEESKAWNVRGTRLVWQFRQEPESGWESWTKSQQIR